MACQALFLSRWWPQKGSRVKLAERVAFQHRTSVLTSGARAAMPDVSAGTHRKMHDLLSPGKTPFIPMQEIDRTSPQHSCQTVHRFHSAFCISASGIGYATSLRRAALLSSVPSCPRDRETQHKYPSSPQAPDSHDIDNAFPPLTYSKIPMR